MQLLQVKSDVKLNLVLARLFFYILFEKGVIIKYGLGISTLFYLAPLTAGTPLLLQYFLIDFI